MTIRGRLMFEDEAVLGLFTHMEAAHKHISAYGLIPDPGRASLWPKMTASISCRRRLMFPYWRSNSL